jgi:hypothetical protein
MMGEANQQLIGGLTCSGKGNRTRTTDSIIVPCVNGTELPVSTEKLGAGASHRQFRRKATLVKGTPILVTELMYCWLRVCL